jgi:tetratricopeptide (TPR) repeat protein
LIALLVLLSGPVQEAERLATAALEAPRPEEAAAAAQRALDLTAEFDPVAFVQAGRKGEVVEDEFLVAREAYRRHRSKLHEAMGDALLRQARPAAARRHLRRALLLDPSSGARLRLGRALVAAGRGREALDALLAGAVDAPALALAEQAADLAGVPSLQAELDWVRLAASRTDPAPMFRDGRLRLPERARLSTGEPFSSEAAELTLVYVADPGCRTCSADLLELKRLAPAAARVVLLPAVPDQDAALRAVVTLYRHRWPYLVGAGPADAQGWPAPSVVGLARAGFSVVVARAPLGVSLPALLEVLQRRDVEETPPRAAWSRLPVERRPPAAAPGLLANGLAAGEDEPFPPGFLKAAAAFDAGRFTEALELIDGLAAAGDGWLLGPEARFNRALCLAAAGRRDEARRLLLRIGDSRFQDAVDAALERIGSPRP